MEAAKLQIDECKAELIKAKQVRKNKQGNVLPAALCVCTNTLISNEACVLKWIVITLLYKAIKRKMCEKNMCKKKSCGHTRTKTSHMSQHLYKFFGIAF